MSGSAPTSRSALSSGEMFADRHPAILAFRRECRDLQIGLAVALGDQVLRRDLEVGGQDLGDRLGAEVGEGEIGEIRADRVGVAFDQEDLAGVVGDRRQGAADALELPDLVSGTVAWPKSKVTVSMSIRRTLSRRRAFWRTSSSE